MSLAIAELLGNDLGILSGENQYRQKSGGSVRLAKFKAFSSGKFAFGITGTPEPFREFICSQTFSSFNECVIRIQKFLQPWNNGDPTFLNLIIMGFDPDADRVRCLVLSSQYDFVPAEIPNFGHRISSGSGDDIANEFLGHFHRTNPRASVSQIVNAHDACYRHVAQRDPDVSPESSILIVTRDGAYIHLSETHQKTFYHALPNDESVYGVVSRGSTPVSSSSLALNGMTWGTTSTSVTFAWTQTPIYRSDGSVSAAIPGGTQAVTGLKASQSYTAYPYFDEASASLKWVGSELVFPTLTSVLLNGSTGFIQTATGSTHADGGAGQFTVEFWVKTTSATQQGVLSFSAPQGSGAETALNVQVLITAAGEIAFSYVNTTPAVKSLTSSGAGVNDGAWHHVVIQFATGGTAAIWVDTVNKGAFSAQGAIAAAGSTSWWHIGMAHGAATWPGTANTFLNGSLSNVAIYSGTPITQAQIANHFIAGINQGFTAYASVIAADGPVFYWKLNETSGTSAADSAGTNTGTYSGGFTLNQQAPVVVPTGSPAIMWPYKNFLCSQAQALQSRIPLSNGSLNPSTPASGGGSGGGGGFGGGGQGGCWSGNTRIRTQYGPVRFEDFVDGTEVLTAKGTWKPARKLQHKFKCWTMLDPFHNGELVTMEHPLLSEGKWKRAATICDVPVGHYTGFTYDLEVLGVNETEAEALSATTEHSYTLASGIVAHNGNFINK